MVATTPRAFQGSMIGSLVRSIVASLLDVRRRLAECSFSIGVTNSPRPLPVRAGTLVGQAAASGKHVDGAVRGILNGRRRSGHDLCVEHDVAFHEAWRIGMNRCFHAGLAGEVANTDV
jgi:hypothetical protein